MADPRGRRPVRYTLDAEGNRTTLSDLFGNTSEERHLAANGFPISSESFSLDPASNIATRTGPAATYTYDGANRMTSDGGGAFVWDGADRLTTRGTDTFTYDSLSRLTSASVSGLTRTYTYDGDGLLRSRTEGTTATAFLYDSSIAPAPLLAAGGERIVYGLGPLYQVHANATYDTFVRDGLGSVRLEVSGAGRITSAYDYTAYGALRAATSLPLLGFAGELHDPSGLISLRARWYDPVVGRFMSRDALPGRTFLPISLNAYAYAHDNPIANVDPSGLLCLGLSFGGSGILGNGAAGAAGSANVGLVLCGGGSRGFNVGLTETVGAFAGRPSDTGAIEDARGNIAGGLYAGFGLAGLLSPNATQVSDFAKAFRTEAIDLGIGPLNGSVSYSSGLNSKGGAVDVLAVTPPFLSVGLGAAYSLMTTWTFTQDLIAQSSSPE